MTIDPTLCLVDRTALGDLRRWWETTGRAQGLDRDVLAQLIDTLSEALIEADAGWDLLPIVSHALPNVDGRRYRRPNGQTAQTASNSCSCSYGPTNPGSTAEC